MARDWPQHYPCEIPVVDRVLASSPIPAFTTKRCRPRFPTRGAAMNSLVRIRFLLTTSLVLLAVPLLSSGLAHAATAKDIQRVGTQFTGSIGVRQTTAQLMDIERANPSDTPRQPILVEDREV